MGQASLHQLPVWFKILVFGDEFGPNLFSRVHADCGALDEEDFSRFIKLIDFSDSLIPAKVLPENSDIDKGSKRWVEVRNSICICFRLFKSRLSVTRQLIFHMKG